MMVFIVIDQRSVRVLLEVFVVAFSALLNETEAVKRGYDLSDQEDCCQETTQEGIDWHVRYFVEDLLETVEDDGAWAAIVNVVLELGFVDLDNLRVDAEEVVGNRKVQNGRQNNGNYWGSFQFVLVLLEWMHYYAHDKELDHLDDSDRECGSRVRWNLVYLCCLSGNWGSGVGCVASPWSVWLGV